MSNSLKKYKFILIGILISCFVILLIVGLFSIDNSTNEMIISFLNSNGVEVQTKPVQISHITIPNEFDKIYETYNSIQKDVGFDLTNYKGKAVVKYTYNIINTAEFGQDAVANIFIYDNTIIAADVSSTQKITPLKET